MRKLEQQRRNGRRAPFGVARSNAGTHSRKAAPAAVPGLKTLTSLATGVVMVCAMYFGRTVLIPITLAVLLSLLLAPLVDLLRRLRLGELVSVLVAVWVALSVLTALGFLIGAQLAELASDLPRYQVAIERRIDNIQQTVVVHADAVLTRTIDALKRVAPVREEPASESSRPAGPADKAPLPVEVHEPSPSPLQLAQGFLSPVVSPLATIGIVIVTAIFILLQRADLRERLIRLAGSHDMHRTTTAMSDAARRLSRYFLAQLCVNVCVGAVVSFGLAVIGLPGALLFGVIAGLMRFVPYVGVWIAALPATILAAAVSPDWSMIVPILVLFCVTEVAAGQFLEPLVYGHSTGLSPIAVIVAAIFWSWLWGAVGLVLSTPLTLCLVILGRYINGLEFLDVLFGDRPALTPGERFYQRLLTGDRERALAQADTLLKKRSLCEYYDAVALEGLRQARIDLLRGVVSPKQLRRIRETVLDLVHSLEPDSDATPPLSSASPLSAHEGAADRAPSVLCISGSGKLDDLVATIAVCLLRQRGLHAESAAYERFPRSGFRDARLSGAAVISVISLDAIDAPPYLRDLIRRLSQRATTAGIVVGLCGRDTECPALWQKMGVSPTLSFSELVDRCVLLAQRHADGGEPARVNPVARNTGAIAHYRRDE
ncbi:AI-2 transport protein TqsA [Burkholderia pseudomultivorans]|uniref:AI-2 transport protein TqsA n=1 Tax=Burkholderia pseudomultivorans TaxID=1207504 RepID=A0A6P2NE39_9BURK|nr:AI-2E family transporter [Burkholderia pseudomultivorans]VWB93425.1 AI-2 transport protein TqsA [Burkholderia pseudomultivorans]